MNIQLFFPTFLIVFLNLTEPNQICKLSGIYKVVNENEAENKIVTKIEFRDSTYLKTFELGKVKGVITEFKNTNGKCVLYLKDKPEDKIDPKKISQIERSNSVVAKLETLGEPIMEISEPFGDTIKFKIVHSGNLNVIISKGKLIRQ